MLRKLKSMLRLALSLTAIAAMLSACVVVPYDDGYGHHYHHGYWQHREGRGW